MVSVIASLRSNLMRRHCEFTKQSYLRNSIVSDNAIGIGSALITDSIAASNTIGTAYLITNSGNKK